MDHFINAPEDIIGEAIDGLIAASGSTLVRLDGYPHIRVVLRREIDAAKVAIVSGGGSGHEPAHAGFVGEGMLTAAVCGSIFASPSVDAVLAGILAVTGEAGCLLIVKNYTGDRLNFGLAAERARSLGLRVEMVIVGDDVALPDIDQPRGLAGTLFVHKIAGALAEAGRPLDEVAAAARRVADQAVSLGMSLTESHVLGGADDEEDRIASGEAELGLGIHGEPGAETIEHESAHAAFVLVSERLSSHVPGDGPLIALLNDLGGLTSLEASILTNELMASPMAGRIVRLVGPTPLMTSLDMRGFSLSLLPADDEILRAIDRKVGPAAWPRATSPVAIDTVPVPSGLTIERAKPSENAAARALLTTVCQALVEAQDRLDRLDAKSGDGDTGTTLATAAKALLNERDRLPFADPKHLFQSIGLDLTTTMGGSSGVLLSLFFGAASSALEKGNDVSKALQAGLARVREAGGAERGDRTMIDALEPALEALGEKGLDAAAKAARAGADATAGMVKAGAGRAAYVRKDQLEGHADPGAEAVAITFEALARSR